MLSEINIQKTILSEMNIENTINKNLNELCSICNKQAKNKINGSQGLKNNLMPCIMSPEHQLMPADQCMDGKS